MGMALLDFQCVATAVGSEFAPMRPLDPQGRAWTTADWLHDFGVFWISGEEDDGQVSPPTPRTAAAIELLSLRAADAALPRQLRPLQRSRFGAELSLELGDVTPKRDRSAQV